MQNAMFGRQFIFLFFLFKEQLRRMLAIKKKKALPTLTDLL
jgi:hypothetical protein